MRWFARLVGSLTMLCILVGCNASGAVNSEPPAWCLDWDETLGYCQFSRQDAEQAEQGYVDYVTRNVNEERRQDYIEYIDNPANHGGKYAGQSGNRYNCDDLSSQAAAQAILESDRSDPNNLDRDHDGVACELGR